MNMKKSLFILPLLALMAVSCNPTQDEIFENSAAERLDISREAAKDKLTKDGGLWVMEYFSNPEEPGYVMLFRFDKNGSVEVSANHKWIDNQFSQERSLWTINSDNGTVLSFNSYNNLFHIFADPADITGPNQPVNPDTNNTIDETGTGHEGDYEFMFLKDDDENVIKLLGKKRGYYIYMYRLPSDTNEKEYLDAIRAREKGIFSSYFPKLIITEKSTGERFVATSDNGVMTIYPEDGHSVAQARKKNYIVTLDGIRFMEPFDVYRAETGETTMTEFKFTEDGGLDCDEFEFSLPIDNYEELFFDKQYAWDLDVTDASCPEFVQAYNTFKTDFDTAMKKRGWKLNGLNCYYDYQTYTDRFLFVKSGSSAEMSMVRNSKLNDKGAYEFNISLTDGTSNGLSCLSLVPSATTLINLINSYSYKVSYQSKLAPNVVTLTAVENPQFKFNMSLQQK